MWDVSVKREPLGVIEQVLHAVLPSCYPANSVCVTGAGMLMTNYAQGRGQALLVICGACSHH